MEVARWLVAGLAAVTLAAGALSATRAGEAGLRLLYAQHEDDPGQRAVDQIEGLRRQLVALVPPGATILLGDVPPGYWAWQQRIAEVATLEHRRVVADRALADYRVSIVEDAGGLGLLAEPLR